MGIRTMDPTRRTADTCKKIIKNKENTPKKRGNISSDTLVSALSELQGLLSISSEKISQKLVKKSQKTTFSGREPCVVLCGIIIKNKLQTEQKNGKEPFQ